MKDFFLIDDQDKLAYISEFIDKCQPVINKLNKEKKTIINAENHLLNQLLR